MDLQNYGAWLLEFFSIPENANFWSILNSPILVGLIAAVIGLQINRRVANVESDATTAIRVSENNLEEMEAGEEFEEDSPTEVGAQDFRNEARALADRAKAFIDNKIIQDTDRRHQRTYRKINGHHPIGRAIALNERDKISDAEQNALIAFFKHWNRYSKGRGANRIVTEEVFETLKHHIKNLA